jgi:hypothetical protein
MISHATYGSIRAFCFAAALTAIVSATPAWAADAIFPPGSRIGLVPPPGMVPSDAFDGFADPAKDAAILITILPAAAYAQFQKTMDADVLKKQGVSLEKREPIKLDIGNGFLFIGRQVSDKARYRKWLLVAATDDLTALVTVQVPLDDTVYSDRVVRAALATLSVRPKVPEAEELGLLPFSVTDLAGFHVVGVLRGRMVLLSDAHGETPEDASKGVLQVGGPDTRLLIAALPGGPTEPSDHANFARLSFNEIGGIRDVRVTMSEPLRFGGQSGYQTMAEAKDARSGADIMVVQWLRFGGGGFMQMIGVGRTDSWTSTLSRLRTVRDSVELK